MPLFGPFLSENARRALHRYQYRSSQSGLLDHALNPFWGTVVEFLPLWLAPNVVTFLGGLAFLTPYSLLLYYSPDFKTDPPQWLWWCFAVGLFIYQTMDAIDGKQARRTRSSSPLGQLFDHGVDALNFIPILVANSIALKASPEGWLMVATMLVGALIFYVVNWRGRHEGIMTFGVFSVTEAQWCAILIFVLAGIDRDYFFGKVLFTATLPFAVGGKTVWDVDAKLFVFVFLSFAAWPTILVDILAVERFYAKNPRTTDPGRFQELFHILSFVTSMTLWNRHGILESHPIVFSWTCALEFSGIVHRLIVADVTHEKAKSFHFVFVPTVLIGILSLFDQKMLVSMVGFDVTHEFVVFGNLAWVFCLWFGYIYYLVSEITATLKNHLWSIPYPPKAS